MQREDTDCATTKQPALQSLDKAACHASTPLAAQVPELLAPAGNMVCLHAAVRAGADAVYLGAGDFNARRGADNFTLESLAEACDWAHLRGVRIYLTVNTVILPSEMDAACKLVVDAHAAGVDAFIVQDIGLAAEIVRTIPAAEVHISTQMNTHNAAGVQAAAALGAARVTLAREMALPEIEHLCTVAHEAGMQVEAFAHGALCVCYSGQCFMSSLVGGRSANRGMCAQACRLPYELHDAAQDAPLDAPGEHLLSPKDLSAIDLLPQLVAVGVDSLKIEGRMKSPEYVFAVVSVYRSVLDRLRGSADDFATCRFAVQNPAMQDSSCAPLLHASKEIASQSNRNSVQTVATSSAEPLATPEEKQKLEEAFSRGFTTAYLTGDTGQDMMSYGRPNNRGVFVGRVTSVRDGLVEVTCEKALVEGDIIEFWTNKGHFAHTLDVLEKRRDNKVAFAVARAVGKGDRVFRVRSAEAAFEDSAQDPRVPVRGSIELRIGQPARLSLQVQNPWGSRPKGKGSDNGPKVKGLDSEPKGNELDNGPKDNELDNDALCAEVEGPIVEAARTKAITAEEARAHIDRFGSTSFVLQDLEIKLESGVGLGFSALHRLRAEAAEALQTKMLMAWKSKAAAQSSRKSVSKPFGGTSPTKASEQTPQICVWATNAACARAARKAGADAIYVPALNYKRGEACLAGKRLETPEQAGYPKQTIIALPTVDHDPIPGAREAAHAFDPWKYAKPGKPIFADSLGAVYRAIEQEMQVEVGPHVPVTNATTANELADLGVRRIWLSPELTLGQIQRIAEKTSVELGLFVSGAAELMLTEHCLLQSQGPCNHHCHTCARRKSPHYLKDRKGYEMPVITDCCGRSHLYNAVALDLVHLLPDLVSAGISAVMVDTMLLTTEQASQATARAIRARDLFQRTGQSITKIEGTTTGHIFRGVS